MCLFGRKSAFIGMEIIQSGGLNECSSAVCRGLFLSCAFGALRLRWDGGVIGGYVVVAHTAS